MNKTISQRITVINLIMTAIIVIYHSSFSPELIDVTQNKYNIYLNNAIGNLALLAMSCFFAMSAFLLFRNLTFENYVEKIKKRFFSLFVPYLIWQIGEAILKSVVIGKRAKPIETFSKIFLLYKWPPNGPLWYLYAIFLLAILSPLLLTMFKNKRFSSIMLILLSILAYYSLSIDIIKTGALDKTLIPNLLDCISAYLLGAYYGHFCSKKHKKDDFNIIIAFVLVSLILNNITPFNGFLFHSILMIMPILLIYFMPVKLLFERTLNIKFTFLVYAIHHEFIELFEGPVEKAILHFTKNAVLGNILYKMVFLLLVFFVARIAYEIMKKIAPTMLSAITGGRC